MCRHFVPPHLIFDFLSFILRISTVYREPEAYTKYSPFLQEPAFVWAPLLCVTFLLQALWVMMTTSYHRSIISTQDTLVHSRSTNPHRNLKDRHGGTVFLPFLSLDLKLFPKYPHFSLNDSDTFTVTNWRLESPGCSFLFSCATLGLTIPPSSGRPLSRSHVVTFYHKSHFLEKFLVEVPHAVQCRIQSVQFSESRQNEYTSITSS